MTSYIIKRVLESSSEHSDVEPVMSQLSRTFCNKQLTLNIWIWIGSSLLFFPNTESH